MTPLWLCRPCLSLIRVSQVFKAHKLIEKIKKELIKKKITSF